ncbi:histidine phosphatase family protein [Nocardia stercoris]|uniref:Histidine phosphatase family protein n=1 Tax=Nocardia stercoris TaxID=2483361 RepID=A0A3M2LAT8_9NOCA|nr:histidine phosphatase family protein [Nocardia stercoris]RMI34146.1 histidine phosphatase family protein [Nocardia stercoris]
MQLVLVRHAQPVRAAVTGGPADPELTALGREQAARVPNVLAALSSPERPITRVVASPQRRARDTAVPTADRLGVELEIVDDLAEYDRDLPVYIPIEDAGAAGAHELLRAQYDRIKAGHLPEQIDAGAFVSRVHKAVDGLVSAAGPSDTVVVFAHGGVINVLLQDVLSLARPLTFPIDYCSVTRVLYSRTGTRTAATINENGHVWDLLPRNLRPAAG